MNALRPCVTTAAFAILFAASGSAHAQSYTLSTTSGSLASIRTSGNPLGLNGADDSTGAISVPFSFPFFGITVSSGTTLYASTNGTLVIGVSNTDYGNGTFPAIGGPSNFLAPFWVDLRFGVGAGDDIYWAQVGSGASAELVVEWSNVSSYAVSTESITFQVRIRADGTIRYVYGNRVTAGGVWTGASIGMEDATEQYGTGAACTPACVPTSVPSGTTLVFTPSGSPPQTPDLSIASATPPSGTLTVGSSVQIPFTVVNNGAGASGSSRVGLFVGLSSPVGPNDVEAGSATVPGLAPGGSHQGSMSFTVPPGPGAPLLAALIVDPDGVITETSETNNIYSLGSFTIGGGGGTSITITTSELPPGTVGIPYDVTLQQIGGTSPTWRLFEGSLPSGLTLSSAGRISGTPTEEGVFGFTVEASEPDLDPGYAAFSVPVSSGGGGITVTPATLPEGRVGVPYTATLSATGGAAPYAFQVISGRPDWLLADSQGQLTGTPDAPGSFMMTVSVFDSELRDSTAVVRLDVLESGPVQVVSQIPAGVTGRAYDQRVIRGGIPPYQITILDGAFPDDLAVDASGMLRGNPTSFGTWQVTVQVTDANNPPGTAAGAVSLTITELRELQIPLGELAIATRTDVDASLSVSGGVPPYRWSITQGALQVGLTFVPAEGRIVGRVEEASTATVTFSVQDNDGSVAERAVRIIARGFRSGGGGGSTGRTGGCTCVVQTDDGPLPVGPSGWAGLGLLLGLGGVVRLRRARALTRSRSLLGSSVGRRGVTRPRGH